MSAARRPSRRQDTPDEKRAHDILRSGDGSPADIVELADRLKGVKRFGLARRLLAQAWEKADDPALRRRVRQKRTLCTYKDPDLPVGERLERAIDILSEGEDLATTRDQESLGLAGAIYKRWWELNAQKHHLERSLSYYLRGYRVGPESDQGYTGVNAAFVLDLLASLEAAQAAGAGLDSEIADGRSAEARRIRQDLAAVVPALVERPGLDWLAREWWYYATVIEVMFGLRRYDEAIAWVERGKSAVDPADWELHSTAMQLATLARVQNRDTHEDADALGRSRQGEVLDRLLDGRATGVRTAFIGKVGLALSGGGFRASLFHIGVLARLAEMDVLRHVEVLSCVSGGSIVGAHYYLEVRQMLRTKTDDEITREDYVDLVKRVERDFLAGVQKNIRSRIAAEFTTNLKMMFWPGFSRTMRAGDLYERHLYSRVKDDHGGGPRWLTDLYVQPKGEAQGFRPRNDNWRRAAKVPDLVLNATTLNTGHNWQFTASWMGEPPTSSDAGVDNNAQLRRMYYWEAPEKHRFIRLGHAVGASACVPGLFEPLGLAGLYPDMTVQLVDGGVHDNQGVVALLENDCSVVLVSDASGQLRTAAEPPSGALGVALRASSILQARVRAEEYDELRALRSAGVLRGLMFIHLTQDLHTDPQDWIDCEDPFDATEDARPTYLRGKLTRYKVRKDVQERISLVRTDLDSFSDVEAFALMTSGYCMTEWSFDNDPSLQAIPRRTGRDVDWRFLRVEPAMKELDASKGLMRILSVSHQTAFKVWRLLTPLKVLAAVLGAAAAAGLGWLAWLNWDAPLIPGIPVKAVGEVVLLGLAGAAFGKWVVRISRLSSSVRKALIGLALAGVGWFAVRIHLWVFDRLFLSAGGLERLDR